jgi:phospholipase/carboxylesterase
VTLLHVARPPARPTPRPPLLVLLHGIGADENDLLPLAAALDPRLLCASVRAPHEAMPMGYAWYAIDWSVSPPAADLAQAEESRAALCALLPELSERHGTDPDRTFLFGFSQGAAMALEVALTRPDLVRGAVLHSGRALPGLGARLAPPAEALARLEVQVLHGVDDDVLPVARGREIRDLLAPRLGARLAYREHAAGHFVTEASLGDAAAWLAARVG